jgi:hypothetical protein
MGSAWGTLAVWTKYVNVVVSEHAATGHMARSGLSEHRIVRALSGFLSLEFVGERPIIDVDVFIGHDPAPATGVRFRVLDLACDGFLLVSDAVLFGALTESKSRRTSQPPG